jgi:4-hydroxythreonine-4-phosphate dehydrogenase
VTAPLVLTIGEPAGIGPDLALALWTRRRELDVPAFLLVGDPELLAARARILGGGVPLAESEPNDAEARFRTALPVLPVGVSSRCEPGAPDATSAPLARAAIDRAAELVLGRVAGAMVTNPIAKSVMQRAGFAFPGHTEYLAHLAASGSGRAPLPVMLIWCEELAVVPVTIHVPLADVPRLLTAELIVETGRIVARDMAARFGVPKPRLAVCGLNPHAGEGGTLGKEEETVIRPAIERLQAQGVTVTGPHSADTLFHAEARIRYDVALGMFHDQVLGPIKTLAFERAVNVTLGLPFVRTSPDHGTAFDLAGTGRANPSSLLAALKLARRLADAA